MKRIRVFKTLSNDKKYSFLKFKDDDDYVTLTLQGDLRPNAFPCIIEYDDEKFEIVENDRGYKGLTISDYEIFYEFYNVKRKKVFEVQV